MTDRPRQVRCLVTDGRVRVRLGRGGWRPLGGATTASRLARHGDRVLRFDAHTRAAVLAADVALEGAAPARPDRVFLWVTMEDGCAAADRSFWESAEGGGGAHASPQRFVATLPSYVAGEIAQALALRGPAVVTAGGAPPRGGVDRAALDAAAGAADLLLFVSIAAGARPRVLAVAVPLVPGDSLGGVSDPMRRPRAGGGPRGR